MTAIVVVMTFAPIVVAGAYSIDTTYNQMRSSQRTNNNYIILHETGGVAPARNNAQYFNREWRNAGTYSSHVVGDGGKVYQISPEGYVQWAAGSYANANSPVQIELARTNNKTTFEKDYKTYVSLARDMAKKYNIPLTLDTAPGNRGIKSHLWITQNYWGDHTDPYGYLSQWGISKSKLASDLRNGVGDTNNASKQTPKPGNKAPTPDKSSGFHVEKATFTNGDTPIRVRRGTPGLSAPKAGMLPAGAKINYDGWVAKDGYTWVRYTGNSGNTLYLPVRHNGKPYGTFGNGKASQSKPASQIAEDGQWGNATTRRLQQYLGTSQDGVISGQIRTSANANVYSAQWGTSGSNVIRALQAKLGVAQDGNLGPATVRALQAHLGTMQDGVISPRSNVVKAMQHALNNGTF